MRKGIFFHFSLVKLSVYFKLLPFLVWKVDEAANVNPYRERERDREAKLCNHAKSRKCHIHKRTVAKAWLSKLGSFTPYICRA